MNGRITTLPPAVAEAFERALMDPAGDDRKDNHVKTPSNGQSTATPLALAPAQDQGALQTPEAPRQQSGPLPPEEQGSPGGGSGAAEDLGRRQMRKQEDRAQARPKAGTSRAPDQHDEPQAAVLGAGRAEDAESEVLAVCVRHLALLTDAGARRVLEYLAQRFVVDGTAS
jgi:hypothetical protein